MTTIHLPALLTTARLNGIGSFLALDHRGPCGADVVGPVLLTAPCAPATRTVCPAPDALAVP